jgi:hypothetical protein
MMPLAVTFPNDEDAVRYFEKVAVLFRSKQAVDLGDAWKSKLTECDNFQAISKAFANQLVNSSPSSASSSQTSTVTWMKKMWVL